MIREIFVWLRVFLSRRRDGELEEELRFHIEQSIEQKIAAGMTPREARRQALIEFGGVERTREDCVEERPGWLLDSVWQDIRYAVRGFRRNPLFTVAVIVTLALGIGTTTAVFSVVDRILFRSLPYAHDERLVVGVLPLDALGRLWRTAVPADVLIASEHVQHLAHRIFQDLRVAGGLVQHGRGQQPRGIETARLVDELLQEDVARVVHRGLVRDRPEDDRRAVLVAIDVLGELVARERFGVVPEITQAGIGELDREQRRIGYVATIGVRILRDNGIHMQRRPTDVGCDITPRVLVTGKN